MKLKFRHLLLSFSILSILFQSYYQVFVLVLLKDVFIWPTSFKIQPGESFIVTLRFRAPLKAQPELLPIFSGFITVSNYVDGKVNNIPYAGVVGDYKNAKILVRRSPLGFGTGLYTADGFMISNGQNMNFTISTGHLVVLTIAWTTRVIFIE
ncbi:unnamed protein product, partial [Rotaria magnacalcarata]